MNTVLAYQKCLGRLILATQMLKLEVNTVVLGEIADLIVQPMTGPWRFFHTPEHVFEVAGNEDAIEILAALFHDVVYVQVDRSINFNISQYISPFVKDVKGKLVIRQADLAQDYIFDMVSSVFGFFPGQELDIPLGQNEFLSALVAAKVLQPLLPLSDLLQITACIEATIPFRLPTEEGLTASEVLYKRLQITNNKLQLGLSDIEIQETVKKGVRIANRDVGSFAYPSAACYLANTWNLLPETNHNLMSCGAYTVSDYRASIINTETFLNSLTPERIFRQFRGEPSDEAYQLLLMRTQQNLEIAQLYLSCKVVTIALVEALSFAIGLDIPLATMMGELPYRGFSFIRLENFLPDIDTEYQLKTDVEKEVFNLLEKGRAKGAEYDLENSPLATFIVKSIGFDGIRQQHELAKDFFQGNIFTENFIASFNLMVSQSVITAVEKMFDSRKAAVTRNYSLTFESKSRPPSNF
ncbi:MAG: hypothetical protein KME64_14950 [Scytonematopsis contorta HA4267-MV1]|jgi:hypothetical protein|nr:hypothetical protein [Scytonematopsis contorta HA4267-MV1]